MNFVLWLHGIAFNPSSLVAASTEIKPGIPGAAPLPELWHYRRLEQSRGENLSEQDFTQSFLSWSAAYLAAHRGVVAVEILSSGGSLVNLLIDVLTSRMRDASQKKTLNDGYSKLRRKGNAGKYGYAYQLFWDGSEVRITQKGFFSMYIEEEDPPLRIFGGKGLFLKWRLAPDKPAIIRFLEDMVLLVHGDRIIFKQSVTSIRKDDQPERWDRQIELELLHRLQSSKPVAGDSTLLKRALRCEETISKAKRR